MGFDHYREPALELSQETRTFARRSNLPRHLRDVFLCGLVELLPFATMHPLEPHAKIVRQP